MEMLIPAAGAVFALLVVVVALLTVMSDPYMVDSEEKEEVEREFGGNAGINGV